MESPAGLPQNVTTEQKLSKCNEAIGLLQEMFGEGVRFETRVSYLINQEQVGIIMLIPETGRIIPGAFLDGLPETCSVEELANSAALIFQDSMKHLPELQNSFKVPDMSREGILNSVILQTLSVERNVGLLQGNLHFRFLDLAGVYRIPMESDLAAKNHGILTTLIPNDVQEAYRFSPEELYTAAKKNTLEKYGVELINTMAISMMKMFGVDFRSWHPGPFAQTVMDRGGFYTVTNRIRLNGSSLILIPEVLEALGEKAGCDYFILPSSIDEFQILRDDGNADPDELKETIYEINRIPAAISPSQILTDSLYHYSRDTKTLSVA